jgi:hypothetical protein
MKTLLALLSLVPAAFVALPAPAPGPAAAPPAATGQEAQATARLYAREEAGRVRVAVEVALRPSWHLYHGPTRADLGPEDAVGKPTTLALDGVDVAWEPVEFPAPERAEQDLGFGEPTWINQHSGTFVLRAQGEARGAVDLAQLVASLDGLTCSDIDGRCIPYEETLKVAGPGADALFPESASAQASTQAADTNVQVQAGGPFHTGTAPLYGRNLGDGFGTGSGERVDGTLWVRPEDGELRAAIRVVMAPHWHLYHGPTKADMGLDATGKPTTVEFSSDGLTGAIEWGPVVYPKPERVQQDSGWRAAASGRPSPAARARCRTSPCRCRPRG